MAKTQNFLYPNSNCFSKLLYSIINIILTNLNKIIVIHVTGNTEVKIFGIVKNEEFSNGEIKAIKIAIFKKVKFITPHKIMQYNAGADIARSYNNDVMHSKFVNKEFMSC